MTLTYTGNGRLQTVKNASSKVTTLESYAQDRVTTDTFTDSTSSHFAHDRKGNAATVTDERNNSTSYSDDALYRRTGMTDALSNY